MKLIQSIVGIIVLLIIVMGASAAHMATLDQRMNKDILLTRLDGSEVSLKDLASSKATVINFTTTWCSDCKKIAEILDRLMPEYQPQGVEFIFVYVGQKSRLVEKALNDKGMSTIPLRLLDVRRSLSKSLEITSVPVLIMVDASGTIKFEGFSDDEESLSSAIAALVH